MPNYSKQMPIPGKSAQEIYTKVDAEIRGFLEKTPVGKFELKQEPQDKKISVKSSMMNATLFCEDGCLRLEGSLSFLAAPFKGKLDEGIEKWVKKHF